MSKVLPAKGFRDFSPAQKRQKERLIGLIRDRYLKYGFDEIETPAVEPLERLRGSEGGENLAMIFEIMRRGEDRLSESAKTEPADLGLRYDLTVPLARYYATNRATLPAVFRSIQIGPVWRAEKPQRGRYRQFTQCDIDILGESAVVAEIELILATLEALADAGLPGASVKLNDRRLLDAALDGAGLADAEKSRALILIDKIDKIGVEQVVGLLDEAFPGDRATQLAQLVSGGSAQTNADVDAIIAAVRATAGPDSISFDPALVRGMGYYTGPIFEVRHPASPGSLAGGGRYDNMVGKFAGETVPACGFSIGLDRLMELAVEDAAPAGQTFDKVVLMFEDHEPLPEVLARHRQLLATGRTVRLVRSPRNKQRLFDDLKRAGYQGVQRLKDDVSFFREV